jgi:RNA polymerase sigma-70 factor (ECF subfamily)
LDLDPTDEDLLARLLRGESDAFDELMRRHEDRIFALALSITGDRGDALEATQETFLALWRKAASFGGRARFGTWLYRIGINAARDQVRKRTRSPLLEEDATPDVSIGSGTESVAVRLDVARALADLPAEYREAVVMHDLGDISYEEIAHLTGVPLGTVKSRISRGRRLLAGLLEPRAQGRSSKDAT